MKIYLSSREMMKMQILLLRYYHSIANPPWDMRYASVRENGRDPKNPVWAENGEGCGEVMIWCFEVSMRDRFAIAYAPQRMNTTPSLHSDIDLIAASVNVSHPCFWWEAGSHSRTVRTLLRRRTHWSAQSERSVAVRRIPRSDSSSFRIFLRLGWGRDPSGTENESPIAAHGVWYGSCPRITTFTFSKGVISNARSIYFPSGKHRFVAYSAFTKAVSSCQYGASHSLARAACQDGWIRTVIERV